MSDASHRPGLGRVLGLWVVFVLVFVLFGGIGAGVTSLFYEHVLQLSFSDMLYAIVFGATGFIAYRLAALRFGP